MKFSRYLKDKIYFIILFLILFFLLNLLLYIYEVPHALLIATSIMLLLFGMFTLLIEFFRKKKFYDDLINITEKLDKKYLVIEMLRTPNFQEGEILYETLYEINKSMIENVKNYAISIDDFKWYIEMWIHEVKIPLSSLTLMIHNNKYKISKKVTEQIKRIDDYVEQVLFYVRAENAEKDYLIKSVELNKIISKLALRNKDYLLENNIDFIVKDTKLEVLTDSKWLEFILDQIINNSIKYKRLDKNAYIKITALDNQMETKLCILDNGIGIDPSDLPRVFEKTYTGKNGRIKSKSTGMGLYIAKSLCDKLGHKITVESSVDEYTKVTITFSKENYYDVLD